MNVIYKDERRENGAVKYHVNGLEDSEFFDTLVAFLVKQYNAEIIMRSDGITSRVWQLKINDEILTLEHQEDIGNCFYSNTSAGDSALMQTIASDLESRLKDVPYE